MGANDGLVSTASLIVGVAAADTSYESILLAGVAGLVAGAMSMAAGEYVSVSSQADTEQADLRREREELETDPEAELEELKNIYVQRGLAPTLALEVAEQLTNHDALGSHARDELGLTDELSARPIQAAFASAMAFVAGAALPLALVLLVPMGFLIEAVLGGSLLCLAVLGALAARTGGAPVLAGAWRVFFWGALAMAITAGVGTLFGTVI